MLSASTSALPSSATRFAIVRSWRSSGCSASSTRMTVSAKRTARSVSATERRSSRSSIRARRRIPAVSIRRIGRPPQRHSIAIASRVMPGSGPVSTRSSPTRRLTSVDLPTFGRPTIASCSGFVSPASSPASPPRRRVGRRPAPARTEAGARKVRPAPRRAGPKSPPDRRAPAHRPRRDRRARPAPRPCWRPAPPACRQRRSQRAKCRSSRVSPARASTTSSATSARSSERSVCACMRPASVSGGASSSPAVSIRRNARSAMRPSPSRRSRVTPGRSSTSASCRPTSRLNNVDLPTLGRPMIATVKDMRPASAIAAGPRDQPSPGRSAAVNRGPPRRIQGEPSTAIGGEICVVGQQVKGACAITGPR